MGRAVKVGGEGTPVALQQVLPPPLRAQQWQLCPLPVPPLLQLGSDQPWSADFEPAQSLPNEHLKPAAASPAPGRPQALSPSSPSMSWPPCSFRSCSCFPLWECHPKPFGAMLRKHYLETRKDNPHSGHQFPEEQFTTGQQYPAARSACPGGPRTGRGGSRIHGKWVWAGTQGRPSLPAPSGHRKQVSLLLVLQVAWGSLPDSF